MFSVALISRAESLPCLSMRFFNRRNSTSSFHPPPWCWWLDLGCLEQLRIHDSRIGALNAKPLLAWISNARPPQFDGCSVPNTGPGVFLIAEHLPNAMPGPRLPKLARDPTFVGGPSGFGEWIVRLRRTVGRSTERLSLPYAGPERERLDRLKETYVARTPVRLLALPFRRSVGGGARSRKYHPAADPSLPDEIDRGKPWQRVRGCTPPPSPALCPS